MRPLLGVIGAANSGKSTLIQSMTGCKTKTFCGFLENKKTGKKILVAAASPQENKHVRKRFPRLLSQAMSDRSVIATVIAIQPKNPDGPLSLEKIARMAHERDFQPAYYVLDPPYDIRSVRSRVVGRREIEIRLLSVRPLKVALRKLDAREFSHLNARKLASLAGLS